MSAKPIWYASGTRVYHRPDGGMGFLLVDCREAFITSDEGPEAAAEEIVELLNLGEAARAEGRHAVGRGS